METVSSRDFEEVRTLDLQTVEADTETLKNLTVQQTQAQILHEVESTTGVHFKNVAISNTDPRMAACVNVATGEKTINVNMLTKENKEFACYAAYHEKEHCENGICCLNLNEEMAPEEITTIETAINIPGLPDINLAEGFNDLITSDKHGKNMNSAYQHHEVLVVEKLENLAKKTLGHSLKELFKAGKKAEFFTRLKDLAQILMVKKLLANIPAANDNALDLAA